MSDTLTMPRGPVQAPVTPFTDDFEVDYATVEKAVNFHTETPRNPGIVALYNKAEPISMTLEERKKIAEVTIKTVNGRLPVIIHVGHSSTDIALELSLHAQQHGAFAVVAITPYYWHSPREAVFDHFDTLCSALDIGVLAYNSPHAVEGAALDPDMLLQLMDKHPNFLGFKDAGFEMDYFGEVCRRTQAARPEFAVMTGTEYLLGSVPLGGTGSFSTVGPVAPKLLYDLWDAIQEERWDDAQVLQHKVTHLRDFLHAHYPSQLKIGMAIMGRPVGPCRLPQPTGDAETWARIERVFKELDILETEHYGW